MNLSNNFNYSGLKTVVDIGDITVNVDQNYEPGQVKYIQMVDNFETWRTIPKITMANPVGSGYVTVIPNTTKPISNANSYFKRRQLYINPIGGGQENVALPGILGKKWYLDSISFRAYDMHEFLPEWKPIELLELMGGDDIADLFIADAFGVGLGGIVIGWNSEDIVTWDPSPYTTNAYPDFQYANTDETLAQIPPFVGVGKYGQNWATFDTMNQSGSRSGFVGGMLSSDWFPNNFSFNISGSNSATGTITGTTDMLFGSDQFTTYRKNTGNWSHTALPLQLSNMNIEINYPYLGVEIYGAGYNHYLYWASAGNQDESIKGNIFTASTPRTIVQFPIICELLVVQR